MSLHFEGLPSQAAQLREAHEPQRQLLQQPEVQQQQQPPAAQPIQDGFADDPKAALKKGVEETEEHILFSCNICYDLAADPVVTLCGHLYCWPCLYRWLQVQIHCRTCPVCKAGVEADKVIPIYGRGGNEDPRGKIKGETVVEAVPQRPPGQRPVPVARNALLQPAVNVNAGQQQGLGIIPTLFGLPANNGNTGSGVFTEPLTPEQQHQAFLSRLLLMLGSFVIMCLLLF